MQNPLRKKKKRKKGTNVVRECFFASASLHPSFPEKKKKENDYQCSYSSYYDDDIWRNLREAKEQTNRNRKKIIIIIIIESILYLICRTFLTFNFYMAVFISTYLFVRIYIYVFQCVKDAGVKIILCWSEKKKQKKIEEKYNEIQCLRTIDYDFFFR